MTGQSPASITQLLYRVSLEPPGMWFMVLGVGIEAGPPYLNIGNLDSFISGYQQAAGAGSALGADFFIWLRDEAGAFPQFGWARGFLERTHGDHQAAIRLLFDHLHRFLLDTRPPWFVRFNQEPQSGLFSNGHGTPTSLDVRQREHVLAVTNTEPVAAPRVHLSAFEMNDGFVLFVGLPRDVATWWNGHGRRVVQMSDERALHSIREARGEPNDLLARTGSLAVDACLIDFQQERADVFSRRRGGAVHVRDGRLLASCRDDSSTTWEMMPGDTVLMLSPVLLAHAKTYEGMGLPRSLATAQPTAWVQVVDTAERRCAVALRWMPPVDP